MTTLAMLASVAFASSHREAPAISLDPAADLTDFYMFKSPEDPSKVVFILNVNPLEEPGGGPNFHRFDDNVLYEINVDNEGDRDPALEVIHAACPVSPQVGRLRPGTNGSGYAAGPLGNAA